MIRQALSAIRPALPIVPRRQAKKMCIAAVIFLNLLQAQAQEKELVEKFDRYRQNNLQEKIFVHTDKNNYVAGEICWFKIYNVDACFHKPIDLGKVAYVELCDKNDKPVLQVKIALDKGFGDGSLYLPGTIASGSYRLRAYTNWLKNFGADYFFEKNLVVVNVQNTQPQNTVPQKKKYEIAFFPEGGNLVSGITSKVGFSIIGQDGIGVNGAGMVLNEKNDTVAVFNTLRFGIGSFSFTPLAGSHYRALVKLPGGEKQVKDLPAAYGYGYTMHLENTGAGQVKITVQTPDKSNPASGSVFLFVHTRNIIKAVMGNSLQNGRAEFLLDIAKIGDGISHFTVFNQLRQPVCERLFFKRPDHSLQINAVADQPVYDIRKKINIRVSAATESGKNIPANMSMAVYRVDAFTTVDGQGINDYLLLGADLPGTVESPAYYFDQNNDTAAAALDNLMLTQGWRRFKWEDVSSQTRPAFRFIPEINGHIINGRITPLQPGQPVSDIKCFLSVPGIRTQFQSAGADADGRVKFEMRNFYGEGEIIAQTDAEKDSGYRVDIEQPFFASHSGKPVPAFDVALKQPDVLKMYIASQVQNTFLREKLNQSSWRLPDTSVFYLKPDAVYLLDNYVRFTTLEEVLREYVFEVNVRKHGGSFHLPVYDEVSKYPFDTDPLVLVDGVPVFNFNKLMGYDPLRIRKLEVIARQYYLGGNAFDGIVNFTTYKGDIGGYDIDPHATVVDYAGLQLQRDFYAPVYETAAQAASRLPDFRNLLYWSPRLVTGDSGKEQASFYSSDIPGRYAIVVQGISADGRAGTKVSYFEVRK